MSDEDAPKPDQAAVPAFGFFCRVSNFDGQHLCISECLICDVDPPGSNSVAEAVGVQ
ncbi:hypothetical protein K466DRAFT_606399 [Polyporus arcularius HHB13444]|uniref:Uncharacterized protein n=1 Tax=Polyporus arcularius HHB13444 TaxID=1314778 RepID=A0A5C3P043_9APHY|nr:hypothetical protein K466DRAFT_606399 [Polyporus arcularius HHB13444]